VQVACPRPCARRVTSVIAYRYTRDCYLCVLAVQCSHSTVCCAWLLLTEVGASSIKFGDPDSREIRHAQPPDLLRCKRVLL
jgi:hypothetical protein